MRHRGPRRLAPRARGRGRGAEVAGIDASERALATARDRFGDRATVHHADLADPLDCLDDDGFDLLLSHLVLGHVERLEPAFREFRRVLRPGGVLVFATVHPVRQYLEYDEIPSYYEPTRIEVPWPGAEIPVYYRPPGQIIEALLSAGFALEAYEEPAPEPEYGDAAPKRYEDALERPEVLCVRARVRGEG